MIIQKIRAHSASHHQELESSSILVPLNSVNVTTLQYTMILQKFYAFFHGLEINFLAIDFSKVLPDFSQRRKSILLLEDLHRLGHDAERKALPELPQLKNLPYAFGCLYVLEGSTLGGKFIYQNVSRSLQLNEKSGASFFYGYGSETGKMWKLFVESLQEYYNQEPQIEQDVLDGVKDTFIYFKNWLNVI